MDAVLWVLERPSPEARRLASQQVSYTDPPREHCRFECATADGRPFKTEQVIAAQAVGSDVYFRTRHTPYLLERAPF